jgi:hypothetical protein
MPYLPLTTQFRPILKPQSNPRATKPLVPTRKHFRPSTNSHGQLKQLKMGFSLLPFGQRASPCTNSRQLSHHSVRLNYSSESDRQVVTETATSFPPFAKRVLRSTIPAQRSFIERKSGSETMYSISSPVGKYSGLKSRKPPPLTSRDSASIQFESPDSMRMGSWYRKRYPDLRSTIFVALVIGISGVACRQMYGVAVMIAARSLPYSSSLVN